MNEMDAIVLPPSQWDQVEPYVTGTFHNAMPETEKQAIFLAAHNEYGKLRAFAHLEVLLHVSSIWVTPEERNTRTVWQLMYAVDQLLRGMPGFSAVAFPNSESHRKLYERLGARNLGNIEVWRKDY
jgi:hypothetical protein